MSKSLLAAASALALLLAGCASTGGRRRRRAPQPRRRAWAAFSHSFIDGYFRLNPAFAVNQGRHEYDGQLPDWSETGLANRSRLPALVDRRRRRPSIRAG